MGSWVEDFDSFQFSTHSNDLIGGIPRKPQSKKEKLEAELKLLQWHKLANEAAIKAALAQTKTIKEIKSEKSPAHSVEDVKWMKKVIDQERTKPLEVSKDFVLNYNKKEKERSNKLSEHVDRHIETLRALRQKVETKNETMSRSNAYRTWRRDFNPKKNAVLLGKTIDDMEPRSSYQPHIDLAMQYADPIDRDIDRYNQSVEKSKSHTNKDLLNVLNSLQKLSELENRISSLETNNAYDTIMSDEKQPPSATKMQFKKQRSSAMGKGEGSMKMTYSLKLTSKIPLHKQPATAARLLKVKHGAARVYDGRTGYAATVTGKTNGVFLTDFDTSTSNNHARTSLSNGDQMRLRDKQRQDRQRDLALAPMGKKNLWSRVQDRKKREKQDAIGTKKHDEAMQEILRRRQELSHRKQQINQTYGTKASKGASSGIHSNNKYVRDFQQYKQGIQRQHVSNQPYNRNKQGLSQSRLSNDNHMSAARNPSRQLLPPINNRMPLTKNMGTTTRRSDINNASSLRRRLLGADHDIEPYNDVAVAGIGGLRTIRNQHSIANAFS